jgi:branched-chain amino acid transport system ATP-binding protein
VSIQEKQAEQLVSDGTVIIEADDLEVDYGKREVLHGVSIKVGAGEVVTILGHNGAGKTTLLKSIFGLVPVQGGTVRVKGKDVTKGNTIDRVRAGISFTPAETPIFPDLTIRKNLELGAFTLKDDKLRSERLDRVHDLFPLLKERPTGIAGQLSGGQQRMLAVGIALMTGARLMLLDEPSLGIAPRLVADIFEAIGQIAEVGTTILLVEQNTRLALKYSTRAYVLRTGEIAMTGPSKELAANEEIKKAYLGG